MLYQSTSEMKIFATYTIFIHFCACTENGTPFVVIKDNALEVQHVLYGDLTDMSDLFLPPMDKDLPNEPDEVTEKPKRINWSFDYIKDGSEHRDIQEYNEITKILNNETRRYWGTYYGWKDPDDSSWWTFWNIGVEDMKRDKFLDLSLVFLYHARYQVKKVLTTKHTIRVDKRYKIGYLFNRLRRIKYEQQKLVSHAHEVYKTEYGTLHSLLKLYEKIVRYDVDITDTVMLIKDIDQEVPQTILMPGITRPNWA